MSVNSSFISNFKVKKCFISERDVVEIDENLLQFELGKFIHIGLVCNTT